MSLIELLRDPVLFPHTRSYECNHELVPRGSCICSISSTLCSLPGAEQHPAPDPTIGLVYGFPKCTYPTRGPTAGQSWSCGCAAILHVLQIRVLQFLQVT